MERWTSITINRQKKVTIISAYRVCITTIRNTGPNTIFYQQWDILENRGKQIEIRSKIIEDLIVLINELQPDNREVILTIDANEQFESGKGDVAKLMSMTKIVDPIECTHGLQNIPNTYQRGSKRIDFIFTFPKTYKYIRACGITTFSQVSPSNHRGIFINVDLISLLQNKVQTNIDLLSRLLRSNDIKQVTKYKQTL